MLHLYQTLYETDKFHQNITKLRKKKKLCCATCYKDENLTLHHVVPQFIGKHLKGGKFLYCMTVVLCRKCHDKYEKIADKVRLDWARDIGYDFRIQRKFICKNKLLARKYATSILHSADQMNHNKLFERREFILSYLSKDSYTYQDLLNLSNIDPMTDNPNWRDLGQVMIDEIGAESLINFWQNHFLQYERRINNFIGVAA